MRDLFLESGVAFKKTFPYAVFEQRPKKFANPKILLLNIDLELKSEKEYADIRLSDPLQYKSLIDAEWNIINDKLDKCVQSGAKIVLSRLAIGDLVAQYFADRDVFCAGHVSEEDLNQVAAATGGTVQASFNNVIDEVLGSCEIFEEKQVGNERCNIFRCPSGQMATIVLRDLTKNNVGIVDNPCKEIDLNHITSTINRRILTVESKAGVATSEKPNHILDDHPVRELDMSFYSKPLPPLDEILSNHNRSIVDLPPALISEILNCLDPKELGIVSCVSTYLCRLASELHVWKEFYCERWGVPISRAPHASDPSDEKSWKELFAEREFRCGTFLGRYSIEVLYGHTEAVRTVSILSSKKLIFTSGYDSIVKVWDVEEGLSVASSRPLGCTIRAVAVDTKLLLAGGTDGFIHGWRAEEGHPYLFDLNTQQNRNDNNKEFRLWEHEGPITCLALDFTKIYSGSWDMSIRIWDRRLLKCTKVLRHNDWIWSLAPHDTTVVSTSGSNVYVWDTNSGVPIAVISNAHTGNTYSLARSHTGNLFFTGGEDGVIHMFEITNRIMGSVRRISTWIPHTGPVYSLSFEFPWLVSASSDGKLSLIDVRRLLKSTSKHLSIENLSQIDPKRVEPPQRVLHGFGTNLFSVDIGVDRIVCAGEEGVVRVWNFSEALEIERRVRASRGIRLENRMRRRKLQTEMNSKGGRSGQVPVKLNQMNSIGDRNGVWSKRGVSGKG